eukprot:EG_transcript_15935
MVQQTSCLFSAMDPFSQWAKPSVESSERLPDSCKNGAKSGQKWALPLSNALSAFMSLLMEFWVLSRGTGQPVRGSSPTIDGYHERYLFQSECCQTPHPAVSGLMVPTDGSSIRVARTLVTNCCHDLLRRVLCHKAGW